MNTLPSWALFLGWLVLVVMLLVGVCGMFIIFSRMLDFLVTSAGIHEEWDDDQDLVSVPVLGPFRFPCPTWDGNGCRCSPEFSCQEPNVSVTVVDQEGSLVSLAEVSRDYMEREVKVPVRIGRGDGTVENGTYYYNG